MVGIAMVGIAEPQTETETSGEFPLSRTLVKPEYVLPKTPAGFLLEYRKLWRGTLLLAGSHDMNIGDTLHDSHLLMWSRVDGDANGFFRVEELDAVRILGTGAEHSRHFQFYDKRMQSCVAAPLAGFPCCCELSTLEYDIAKQLIKKNCIDAAVLYVRERILTQDKRCERGRVPAFYGTRIQSDARYPFNVDLRKSGKVHLMCRDDQDVCHSLVFAYDGSKKVYTISQREPSVTKVDIEGDVTRNVEITVTEGPTPPKVYRMISQGISKQYLPEDDKQKSKDEIQDAILSLETLLRHTRVWDGLNQK